MAGLRDYQLTLSAGVEQSINIPGNFYHVLESTSDIQIRFDEKVVVTRSESMGGEHDYEKVTIVSVSAQTIKIALGFGSLFDSRATVTGAVTASYANANLNVPFAGVSIGAGATVLLRAANANRKSLRIGIKSTEVDGVYIGNVAAGVATPGGWLELGSVEHLATEAAVYAYNPGATAIVVNLLELERV